MVSSTSNGEIEWLGSKDRQRKGNIGGCWYIHCCNLLIFVMSVREAEGHESIF